jgi:hypothetical protein
MLIVLLENLHVTNVPFFYMHLLFYKQNQLHLHTVDLYPITIEDQYSWSLIRIFILLFFFPFVIVIFYWGFDSDDSLRLAGKVRALISWCSHFVFL